MTHHPRYFDSPITRQIWGSVENIVLIYVGAAAEFALNRDVHETFAYNQRVLFSPLEKLTNLGKQVRAIHRPASVGVGRYLSLARCDTLLAVHPRCSQPTPYVPKRPTRLQSPDDLRHPAR